MKIHIYRNASGKFGWRWTAANGQIIATDHGQGYERKSSVMRVLRRSIMAAWLWDNTNRLWFDTDRFWFATQPQHGLRVHLVDLTV